MKRLFLIFLSICLATISFSQEPDIIFGKVKQEELNMKVDASDSTAEAVLLYEKKAIYFTNIMTSELNEEYHARIKILNSSGLDRGNISLSYVKNEAANEAVYDIEGFSYNYENGQLVTIPLNSSSIFEEKISDTRFVKKIILSNVKVGSVIEYKFKRRTPFSINNTPNDWYFQGDIPFKWSEINITIPASLSYRIIFGGYLPLHIKTIEKARSDYNGLDGEKYRFVVKDAPAFKDESFITSSNDYMSKVHFGWLSYYDNFKKVSFSDTWADLATYLNNHQKFGERLKRTSYLKELVKSFSPITDSLESINAVFAYMTSNFTWNNHSTLIANDDLKTVFDNKKGSCAEINLLLLTLLRELGFDADPVLLISRGNGVIKEEYPMLDDLNYVIVQVKNNGKRILMDATDPNSMPGLLPERCLNGKACVLEKKGVSIIPINPLKSTELITIYAEMDSTGKEITGNYNVLAGNYKSHFFREFVKYNTDGEKGLVKFYKSKLPDWEIEKIKTENLNNPFASFKLNFTFNESFTFVNADKIFLYPLFSEGIKENPFKMKDRYYPVDLKYPEESIILVNLKIPDNYKIEEVPKNLALTIPNKGGKFMYVIETEGNLIKIKSQLFISKAYYTQDEYYLLKAFYKTIVQKQAEQIVLKKIKK